LTLLRRTQWGFVGTTADEKEREQEARNTVQPNAKRKHLSLHVSFELN
jgi:hypothetical protein